jgi:hypothetical protein
MEKTWESCWLASAGGQKRNIATTILLVYTPRLCLPASLLSLPNLLSWRRSSASHRWIEYHTFVLSLAGRKRESAKQWSAW